MIPRDPFSDPDVASEYAFDQERIAEADALITDDGPVRQLAASLQSIRTYFGAYGPSVDSTYEFVRAVADEFGRGLRNEDVEPLAGEVESMLLDGRPTSEIVEHLAKRFAERP